MKPSVQIAASAHSAHFSGLVEDLEERLEKAEKRVEEAPKGWVARDFNGDLYFFSHQPVKDEGVWTKLDDDECYYELNKSYFPNLKPGEKKEVRLV